ncbi:MAG: hypothetical protein AB1925_07965 [Actinomycetota bacterium]
MHSSIGKPLVALVSAACLAAPAMTPTTPDSVRASATTPVALSAAVTTFDPVPPSLRTLNAPVAPTDDATLVDAVDTMAELSGVDRATLLLQLLTAPYHNVLGVSKAVGSAVNAVLQVASLPLSVATYVLTNRTNEIPDYVASVRQNLTNALPGISTAIKTEIQYDLDLISQVFGAQPEAATADKVANSVTAQDDPVDKGTLLLQLLTIPYHNVLGVSKAVGGAVNAVVQLASLPFSVFTYVLTNRTNEIPAYVDSVRDNLKGALPGISTSIKNELAYNKSVIDKIFGSGTESLALHTRHAPNVLAGDADAATALDNPHPFLTRMSVEHNLAEDPAEADSVVTPRTIGGKHRAPEAGSTSDEQEVPTVHDAEDPSDTKADSASGPKADAANTDSKTESKAESKKPAPSLGGKHHKPEADAA